MPRWRARSRDILTPTPSLLSIAGGCGSGRSPLASAPCAASATTPWWIAPIGTRPPSPRPCISRLAGPKAVVIGPRVWPVSLLHSVSVPARPDTRREATQRAHLLTPLTRGGIIETLSFREPNVSDSFRAYLQQELRGPCAVINPGGRLGERRIPPAAFAAAARALIAAGRVPIITWGPGEEALAQTVVQGAPGARMAPPTNLDELAALMRAAGLTVTNNTGPMHLSVAVGAPTLGLFLRIDMERWGHP